MAQDSPVWISPLRSGIPAVDKILNSLSQWLNKPTLPGGLVVGNGTTATYSATTGAQTSPMPASTLAGAGSGLMLIDGLAAATGVNGSQIKIQGGSFSATFSAANSTSGTLTYPTAFTATPTPVATVQVAANLDINFNWQSTSATAATWRAFQNTGVAITGTATVFWIAVGH